MTDRRKKFWNPANALEGDNVVWIIVIMLMLISIVCIFSSTSRLLVGSLTRLDLLKKQLMVVGFGSILIIVCYNIKCLKFYKWISKLGFILSLLLLLFLDLKLNLGFIKSVERNGARRIIEVGSLQLHVFEVVKVAMVLYLAWAIEAVKKKEVSIKVKEIWQKIIYIYAPFLIVVGMVLPGSNSAAIFIALIMYVVILIGGGSFRDLTLLAAALVVLLSACYGIYKVSDAKYCKRIGTAVNRLMNDDKKNTELLKTLKVGSGEYTKMIDKLRQSESAKIAIKEGGILGKGPGQSTQRYVVPDISEDYMFSFIVEEYGLWGAIVVMMLYISLLARGSIIARNCQKSLFAQLVVAGLCLLISGQAFLHMAVNAGIGPMTGQTLPIISHGNGAFLCFCGAFGIILSISRIAAKGIEVEAKEAALVEENKKDVRAGLDELDDFESGKAVNGFDEEDYE